MKHLCRPAPPPARPNGTVATIFAVSLPVMLGFIGLVIDLSMLYLRNTELQQLADATAVAAAHELDGTEAGVEKAIEQAKQIAVQMYYGGPYRDPKWSFEDGDSWSESALYLGSSEGGPWVSASSVDSDAAADLLYARVATNELASLPGAPGLVSTTVLRALIGGAANVTAAPASVAGRVGMRVTPLGVCALSTEKFHKRQAEPVPPATTSIAAELVEFGFRRGITYNLLRLTPSGPTGRPLLVNPVAPGEHESKTNHFAITTLKPFFCSGIIAYGNMLPGRSVHVQPLGTERIHLWLNSRFNEYVTDGCTKNTAPPDGNVLEYTTFAYMPSTPTDRAALPTTTDVGAHVTMADVRVSVTGEAANYTTAVTRQGFGPLWIYSKPVHYLEDSPTGADRPTPVTFETTDWPDLYPVSSGLPFDVPTAYPSKMPAGDKTSSPSGLKQAGRRMLNLPLLDCSDSASGTATVLGVGRFYMTSKASSTAIYGEFAGLAPAASLTSSVSRLP